MTGLLQAYLWACAPHLFHGRSGKPEFTPRGVQALQNLNSELWERMGSSVEASNIPYKLGFQQIASDVYVYLQPYGGGILRMLVLSLKRENQLVPSSP